MTFRGVASSVLPTFLGNLFILVSPNTDNMFGPSVGMKMKINF